MPPLEEIRSRILNAVDEAHVNRHEWMLTQASCHKKNCPCQATMQRGDPMAAFSLVQSSFRSAIEKEFSLMWGELDADYIKLIEKRLEVTCTTRKN